MLGETKNFKITLTYTLTAIASDNRAALDSALHQVNNHPYLFTGAQIEEIRESENNEEE